ncbi:hypothetical protein WDU94_010749 [Cyamophila willieti]
MPRKRKIITPSKKKKVRAEDIEREIFNVDLSEESNHFSTDTESSLAYDSDKDPEYVPDTDRPSKIPKLGKPGPSTVRSEDLDSSSFEDEMPRPIGRQEIAEDERQRDARPDEVDVAEFEGEGASLEGTSTRSSRIETDEAGFEGEGTSLEGTSTRSSRIEIDEFFPTRKL